MLCDCFTDSTMFFCVNFLLLFIARLFHVRLVDKAWFLVCKKLLVFSFTKIFNMGYNHVFQVCAMFGSSFQTVIAFLKYICLEITFFL